MSTYLSGAARDRLRETQAQRDRRRRRTVSEAGPVDLVSTFVPVDIAVGTDITKPDPIPGGLLDLIARHKGLRADYATERMTARGSTKPKRRPWTCRPTSRC
ncbi:hypothetical protein [Micromonospora wenchangensis]|uniref:hypothetical protein n=1 Tax=Micromonospora wenchangensis TaxID=1185415 RepID=UPI001FED01D7|nr:hypothetical protein [Micromonospora wenchangensis]